MRAPPIMKHPQLFPRLHTLADSHRDLIRADLGHTNRDKRHQPHIPAIRFNEDDRARRHTGDVRLGMVRRGGIGPTIFGIGEAVEVVCGVVGAGYVEGFYDGAADGAVPAVIGEGAEEGLVERSADEMRGEVVVDEHVVEGVGLAFEPEGRGLLDIVASAQEDGAGFAGVVDDGGAGVLSCFFEAVGTEGPYTAAELSGEEMVPGSVAMVRGVWFADVQLLKAVFGSTVVALQR